MKCKQINQKDESNWNNACRRERIIFKCIELTDILRQLAHHHRKKTRLKTRLNSAIFVIYTGFSKESSTIAKYLYRSRTQPAPTMFNEWFSVMKWTVLAGGRKLRTRRYNSFENRGKQYGVMYQTECFRVHLIQELTIHCIYSTHQFIGMGPSKSWRKWKVMREEKTKWKYFLAQGSRHTCYSFGTPPTSHNSLLITVHDDLVNHTEWSRGLSWRPHNGILSKRRDQQDKHRTECLLHNSRRW